MSSSLLLTLTASRAVWLDAFWWVGVFTSWLVYRGVRVRFDSLLRPIPEMLPKRVRPVVVISLKRGCKMLVLVPLFTRTCWCEPGEKAHDWVCPVCHGWRDTWRELVCAAEVMLSLREVGHVRSVLLPFPFAFRWVRDDRHKMRQSYSSVFGVGYVAAFARNKKKKKKKLWLDAADKFRGRESPIDSADRWHKQPSLGSRAMLW